MNKKTANTNNSVIANTVPGVKIIDPSPGQIARAKVAIKDKGIEQEVAVNPFYRTNSSTG